jgi:DNA mismatch repair ATPase MutL
LNDRQYLGQRYATSKISNYEDIDSVRSYGFRGEAIASLCSIGDLSITTCIDGEATATTLQFDRTGSLVSYVLLLGYINDREKITAGQRGTTVAVRSLFRDLPVRLTQARKQRVSVGKVKSIIFTYALVRDIRFTLQFRGNRKLEWTVQPASDALSVATCILGKEFMHNYITTTWYGDGISIDGILPPVTQGPSREKLMIDTSAKDKQLQSHYVYIDNRPMSLTLNPGKRFLKMLRESYPPQNLQHSFVYLNFHCEVDKIKYDCNLDPAKSEVVFEQFDVVCDCLTKFLEKALGTTARPPSSISGGFFDGTRDVNWLPSPPTSSPHVPVREMVHATASPRNVVEMHIEPSQSRNVNLRQTRLDEYRMPSHAERALLRPSNIRAVNVDLTEGCSTLRPIMDTMTDFDGIDLTEGIVSSRKQPPTINRNIPVIDERYTRINDDADLTAVDKHPTPVNPKRQRKSTKLSNSNTPQKSSPKTPRIKQSRTDLLTPDIRPPVQIKLSQSPNYQGPITIDTTLNPWTIAALTTRSPPSKRPHLQLRQPQDDIFMQSVPSDNIHKLVVVCRVTMEDVNMGQVELLSHIPPVCDLMDFLLRYCS